MITLPPARNSRQPPGCRIAFLAKLRCLTVKIFSVPQPRYGAVINCGIIRRFPPKLQAVQNWPANARPYSRRRHGAGRCARCSSASLAGECRSLRFRASGAIDAPAPGAAEVEAVEMGDLAVAAVADDGGREQGRGLAAAQIAAGRRRTRSRNAPRRQRPRACSSASISAGDRKSSPPGSHAWQSRSPPNQSRARGRGSAPASAGVDSRRPSRARGPARRRVLKWVPARIG